MANVNLKQLFLGLQQTMFTELNLIRSGVSHPGEKGTAVELNWIEWMRTYLPKRYCIDGAFVVDCDGQISDQIDIVIYDRQYSPFVFCFRNVLYIPAESVYAIFEVKQELTKENLQYAANKIASVRALKRTSAHIVHAGGRYTEPKKPFKVLGGILTSTSAWNPPLGDSFETLMKDLRDERMVDIGASAADGSFSAKLIDHQIFINRSTHDEMLIFLFLTLMVELQQMGTVPAMDITEYAKGLSSF